MIVPTEVWNVAFLSSAMMWTDPTTVWAKTIARDALPAPQCSWYLWSGLTVLYVKMKLRAVESDRTKCKHLKSGTFWKDLLWQVATCRSVTQSRFLRFQKQLGQQMNWVLQHSTRISCLWSLCFNPVAGGKQKWEAQQCGRSSRMCSQNTGDRCWNTTWMRRRMSVLFVRGAVGVHPLQSSLIFVNWK